MNRIVEFYDKEITSINYIVEDAYEFHPKGRFKLLQRWAWKFLHKTKALKGHWATKDKVTRVSFDKYSFMEKIFRMNTKLEISFGVYAKRLLIGQREFAELIGTPEIQQYLTFDTEYHVASSNHRGYDSGYKIINLKVEVIPWMTGMVVMP